MSVTLTYFIGKILKSVINDKVSNHLGKMNTIKHGQRGCKKLKSWLTTFAYPATHS